MNFTKSIKHIGVDQTVFQKLCECRQKEIIWAIQDIYQELKKKCKNQTAEWLKIKDKDCYLQTTTNTLYPDTQKMKRTYLTAEQAYSSDYSEYVASMMELRSAAEHDDSVMKVLEELQRRVLKINCDLPTAFDTELAGLPAKPMSRAQMRDLRRGTYPGYNSMKNGLYVANGVLCNSLILDDTENYLYYSLYSDSVYDLEGEGEFLKISVHEFPRKHSLFTILMSNGFTVEGWEDKTNEAIIALGKIMQAGVSIEEEEQLKKYLIDNQVERILNFDLRPDAIESEMESVEVDLLEDNIIGDILKSYYNESDYKRARIQKYNPEWYLSDEGKGHWELWENFDSESPKGNKKKATETKKVAVSRDHRHIRLKNAVIARNPIADIRHDAVVGIDFGTKSTIVTVQDGDDQIVPLRVGMADYAVAPVAAHFENPTVMEFWNLGHFLAEYERVSGRPYTSWEDLMISHEAFHDMLDSEESIEMSSFVTDIKQWAGGRYRKGSRGHLVIRDGEGYRFDVENYMELTEEDVDLVEIYAYYIGLFINNMHTGIYLDYLLSFPETFSKEIKIKILNSFTKGIKKSIPSAVFEDEDCEKEFRVRQGASEPAAYAACALEQYGIEPSDEGVFYGIFDFGGGTTDYDYGLYKNAPEDEYTYNYVIKHYGSGGDKTLGGENILQLLAYEVFSDDNQVGNSSNLDIMREHQFVYYRPEEGKIHPGTEALNNDGERAMLNTKLMMEVLRPIWEEWPSVAKWLQGDDRKAVDVPCAGNHAVLHFASNKIVRAEVFLFSTKGREQVQLVVDMAMVDRVINERITTGVRNFFEGLVQAYQQVEHPKKGRIHVFLAGNSSKSRRVKEIFESCVIAYNAEMFDEALMAEKVVSAEKPPENELLKLLGKEMGIAASVEQEGFGWLNDIANNHFTVYPPLGTAEARKIQEINGIHVDENDLMAPTGKTGVAFGLVMCREGSMIKVESEVSLNQQIKFNYYIGINYRKHFKKIFDRNVEYGQWIKFSKIAANTETFEFYYSELPEVLGDDVVIKENKSIHKRKCFINNVSEDASIFFRFLHPSRLEYVAAMDDSVGKGEYLSDVYKIDL